MKKFACIMFSLIILLNLISIPSFAKDYTSFNIVFEEKNGEKVNDTVINIYASIQNDKLIDRTSDFTLEGVEWFKYLSAPENEKTAEDYDYVDEDLHIYGILCTDEDVFELDTYSYFLRIARLYAGEEDTFDRNVSINGVDIEEMNGICFNTGNEFYIKTITNGSGNSSNDENETEPTNHNPNNLPDFKDDNLEKKKCKVCRICPIQPLGICLFIWLILIIVIAVVVVILLKKKKDNNTKKD